MVHEEHGLSQKTASSAACKREDEIIASAYRRIHVKEEWKKPRAGSREGTLMT
jgi:hypothetical protein